MILVLSGCGRDAKPGPDFGTSRVQGVRFDPSYYYDLKQPLEEFVDSCVEEWRSRGINTIFFKAYDAEYGAVYKTRYPSNRKTDYGDKDLLRLFLDAAHGHGVRLIAWMPAFEHKGAWEGHPEWRMKAEDGSDLMPFPDHHFLCVRQPGFMKWWKGFVGDLLERYPDLDGMDFAEPAIVWKGKVTCVCPVCKKEIVSGGGKALDSGKAPDGGDSFSPAAVAERARGMTDLLLASTAMVKGAGKTACVTFIATAAPSSDLLPFARQKDLTGLDVDRMLDSPDRPQWVSIELMWQQWADTYDNPATFRPDWTRKAVEQSLAQVGTRAHVVAHVVAHVEITPLGPVEVSPNELAESIISARRGGAQSIEFYDTHLADSPDMDGDGKPDALIGDGGGRVHCVPGAVQGAGVNAAWTYDFGDTSTILSIAPMGDVDKDGKPDCAVGTSSDLVALLNGKGGKTWSVNLGGEVTGVADLGDVDGNGTSDVGAGTLKGFATAHFGGGPASTFARGIRLSGRGDSHGSARSGFQRENGGGSGFLIRSPARTGAGFHADGRSVPATSPRRASAPQVTDK